MAQPGIFKRIINWTFPGANKPAQPRHTNGAGPKGSKSIAGMIEPNQEQRAFGDLVEEMYKDYQVRYSDGVIAANVATVQVSISVEDGDGQKSNTIQEKAQKLWDRSVPSMQPSVRFGRVAFEKDWDFDEAGPCTYIRKLEPMEYRDSKLRLTENHEFDGFEVKVSSDPPKWLPVEPQNAWWLAINATKKNPHGISHYEGAVERAWLRKQETLKNRDLYVRRFAIRGGIMRGPESVIDERTGEVKSGAELAARATEGLYSGGTMFTSNEPHHDPEFAKTGAFEWSYEEANPQALDPAPILSVIKDDDIAILRAMGIPEKAAIEGESVGSFAMVSEQILILFALVDSFVAQWVESFQAYVLNPMREANYGTGPGPKFQIHAIKLTNRPDSFVVELVKGLLTNPQFAAVIMSGGVDMRNVLENLGLPVGPEFETIAQQVAARMQVIQGAAAGAPPAGDTGGGVPGEFSQTSRLQLNRNLKATSDILEAFINGTHSAAVAQTMLEAIGWSPERAKVLIEDASDGVVDQPISGPVAMRNTINQQRADFRNFLDELVKKKVPEELIRKAIDAVKIGPKGLVFTNALTILANEIEPRPSQKLLKGAPKVPDWEDVANRAIAIQADLFDKMEAALAKGAKLAELEEIRKQIEELGNVVRVAGLVIGLMAPFKPKRRRSGLITFSNVPSGVVKSIFPWLQSAIDFLFNKKVIKASEFASLSIDEQQAAFTAPGMEDRDELKKLRDEIAKGQDSEDGGESYAEFQKRVGDQLKLSRAQTETVFRTNIKQGYVSGFDKGMKSKIVRDVFPAVMFSATQDNRVRDTHWDLDGFICLKTDPAYKVLLRAWRDWNCRCVPIAMTLEQAEEHGGLKTISDLRMFYPEVMAKYGLGI